MMAFGDHSVKSTEYMTSDVLSFDEDWYVREHQDVLSLIERGWFLDPLHHYIMAGCREGKNPNAEFREDYYRTAYPDIAKAVDDKVFNCGFEHYLKHGRTEGRRIRPAIRGALVDLTRYNPSSAVQERILLHLSTVFETLDDWDFWLLTRESTHDVLSRLDQVNVSRICVDRIVGDVGERWKDLPVTSFLAPFGASELYGPSFRTITILPEIAVPGAGGAGQRSADLERALAISEVVFCLSLADRATLINAWQVERDRVLLLHLPPSNRIAGEPQLPMALRSIAGRPFVVTDLTGDARSLDVAFAALAELAASSGDPHLVAVVEPGAASMLQSNAAALGLSERLAIVEEPAPTTWRWLVENCVALLETARSDMTAGLIEDALAMRKPLICAHQSKNLGGSGALGFSYDADKTATVAAACRTVLADPDGAAAATAVAIARAFPALLDNDEPLQPVFDRLATMSRSPGPPREILLGLRDGNRIHSSFWFALPPSASVRTLALEIEVPAAYPAPSVVVVASVTGQPEVRESVDRGRSARLSLALPPTRISGRVIVHPRMPDGRIVKTQPAWPGLKLRFAAVLASGLDLLRSATPVSGSDAGQEPEADVDFVVGRINAAMDLAAPALNALEAVVGPALSARPALRLAMPAMPSVLRAAAPVALHLTRHQFQTPDLRFHGSNKDQFARQQYLRDRGFRIITEPAFDWKYDDLIERLDGERHSEPQVIILEAMLHHPLMRFLRERFPKARLLVRSHNAEVLHRLHTHTASLLMEKGSRLAWLDPREAFARGRNVFAHWRYDAGAIDLADHILSISEWETKRYWPRFGPKSKVSTVPYFLPRDLVYTGQIPTRKARRCVCLTSASPGPVIYDALRNFVRLVDGLQEVGDWEFQVTGNLDARYAGRSSRCRFVGHVDNPIALMSDATSMALLSPYGYGFKTKVLDAISAGSYTLMPQSLLDRHPEEVRPYCLAVDLASPASFKSALERSLEPVPDGDPNEAFRRKAYAAMDVILGLN